MNQMETNLENIKSEEINLQLTTTKIEPINRTFDIGKWPVCSVCGQIWIDKKLNENQSGCCKNKCKGSQVITIQKYIEEVRKEKFDPKKWTFETTDIVAVKDIDLNAEIVSINGAM